ncbi:MAG: hypothetical protein A3I78_00630 [Gammaproteobacteria bacterium RIFCSPLOWO2_02_FULL_56_15]|nr:MAG: hypothetical protein A3I78_00630 [Gammaproteobacteria bacterium RIFCSPLOWO2_02_FULL_56_15]
MNYRLILLCCGILLAGAKCTEVDVTDPKVAAVMNELNTEWRKGYQAMLAEVGARHYPMDRSTAFNGMRKVLEELGFTIAMTEGEYYLGVHILAQEMFTEEEWQAIRARDEPGMKTIAVKHLGLKGNFAELEPEGLMIDGVITLLENSGGVDISITFRLRAIKEAPPESILPRREYPPPYAARTGYEKIWNRFERLVPPLARMRDKD